MFGRSMQIAPFSISLVVMDIYAAQFPTELQRNYIDDMLCNILNVVSGKLSVTLFLI